MKNIILWFSILGFAINVQAQDNNQELLRNLEEQKERGFQYFYIEALRDKLWGRTDEAFNNFQQCLQFDQDNALIYFELSNLYFANGQVKEGYEMLRKASALNPENKWYTLYLANLYLSNNRATDAVIEFEKLHEEDPSNKVYIYRLAMLYTEVKEYDKAIAMYEKLGLIIGETDILKQEIYKLNSLAGRQEVNLKAYKEEIKQFPDNPVNYIRLGDTYLEMQNAKKSIANYKKALKVDPNYGEAYLSFANYYQAVGDTTQMLKSLETAFKHPKVNMDIKKHVFIQFLVRSGSDSILDNSAHHFYSILDSVDHNDAELKNYFGNYLISKQDVSGYELYEESLATEPEQPDLWLQLLGFHLTEGKLDKVLSICEDAMVVYPEMPEFYFYKGLIISEKEQYAAAVSVLKQGLNYSGTNRQLAIRMLSSIGDLYFQLGNMDSTYAYYEKVLSIDAENIMVLNNYAYFLTVEGKELGRAEQMSAKCIEREPNNPTYLDTYAWILYKKGESFLAKFYMEKAMENGGGSNPEVLEHYGYILVDNDEIDNAIQQWEKAISLEWKVEELTQKIQSIKVK